jgi:hypothetical protein
MIGGKKMKYHKYWEKSYFVYFPKFLFKIDPSLKKKISLCSMNFFNKNFSYKKKYRDLTIFFSKNIDFQKIFIFSRKFPPKIEIDCAPFGNVFFESAFSSKFGKNNRNEEYYMETIYNFWHGFMSFKKIILLYSHKLKKGDTFSTTFKINKLNFLESYFIAKIFDKAKISGKNPQFLIPVFCFSPGLGYERFYKNDNFFSKNFSFFGFHQIEFKIILRKKSSTRVTFGPEFRYNERED